MELSSSCCKAEIIRTYKSEEGECIECGSPSCNIDSEDIELFEDDDFSVLAKYYIIGICQAAMDSELQSGVD